MLKSNCSYAVATLLWVICYLWLAPTDVLAQTWRDADCLESVLDSGRWVKISVPSTGICRLTDAELRSMGFEQPENVRVYGYGGNLLSETFSGLPCADLPSTPMMRVDGGLLFYARGPLDWRRSSSRVQYFSRYQNYFSDRGYYFLTDRSDLPSTDLPVQESISATTAQELDCFNEFALIEGDAYSWGSTGRALYEDYDYAQNGTRSYDFHLPGIVTDKDGRVEVRFAANLVAKSGETSFSVTANEDNIGRANISRIDPDNSYFTYARANSVSGTWDNGLDENTTVTITHTRPAGTPGRMDYIAINYFRRLDMSGLSFLAFRSTEAVDRATTFVLSGATENTVVWDVTTPGEGRRMEGSYANGEFRFTISASPLHEFIAFDPTATSGFVAAESEGTVANQNLHGMEGADLIIILPAREDLRQQAERLAQEHRDTDGMTVTLVEAPQIYNEFSSGTPDVTAYRRLMKMLYDRAEDNPSYTRPRYLLLFGDSSSDNRMVTSTWSSYSPEDFLVCYESAESEGDTESFVSDDYIGFLEDSEGSSLRSATLDIGVGRIPVRTEYEAQAVVDKCIAYSQNREAGNWKNDICYIGDDGAEDGNVYMEQANSLATYTEENYPFVRVHRILLDAYRRESSATGHSYPEAHERLLQLLDDGLLMVNYTGHSSSSQWAHERVLAQSDIENLTNSCQALWITASCDFTRFDNIQTSAGETALLNPDGGAIALFTTSRTTYASSNNSLNNHLLQHLFDRDENGERLRLGDIMRLSKRAIGSNLNKLNFSLIGDPALTLAYPEREMIVETFAGTDMTDDYADEPQIAAGGRITVSGYVLDENGTVDETFTGLVYPTVYDSPNQMRTLDNVGAGAFEYTERNKVLYSGMDSVRAGRFEFTFPVPLDINYSNEGGLLNLYALNPETNVEGTGAFSRFTVGGTVDGLELTDSIGPSMSIYLNSPQFQSGDQTNETPYFIAELEDSIGINTVGNGVGHNLTLCIDGSASLTYNLNNYYTPVLGDYTRGTVGFSIPELSAGTHTLTFRAWNLMNQPTTASLEFQVVPGLRPELLSVEATQNPASSTTTFVLSHNRPGSVLDVQIGVYDFSGRLMWHNEQSGVSAGQTYEIDWDLCSNDGQRIAPGVYLYRASITSGGSKKSTQAQKILILAQ